MRLIPIVLAAALVAPGIAARAQATRIDSVDVLIRRGTLVDGTGAPARVADVGVLGGRIVFVGDASAGHLRPARAIDAAGLVVVPGFIDPHTHTFEDLSSADRARRANVPYLMQGVTTVITGNDGGGPVDVGRALGAWSANGIGTNAALLVGQGSVRRRVMGMSDAAPTAQQLDSMRALVSRAMDDGALGMSTGLYYAPGSYATTEEVIALAKAAAAKGGIYDSHLRDESSYTIGLLGSIRETIRIAREASIPVHISHIKALGTDVWGQSDSAIALVRAARAEGLTVTADQYPYTASGTSVGASLLPRWAEAGGRDSLLARIADPATHARLVADMRENMRRRGGPASLLITSSKDRAIVGRTLEQVAQARRVEPLDAALQIIEAGDASVASFNMQDADIERFLVQDFVATGSDGSTGHPRKYGTFPRVLRQYVYGKHLLTIEQAVRRSSQRTAEAFGLADRGVIAPGKVADIAVFDPKTVRDEATYEQPTRLATGMRYVLVNGVVAVDGGRYTGAMAGKVVRRD
jgi:N-acyl-D-aspartate/D-glutamate deacylase